MNRIVIVIKNGEVLNVMAEEPVRAVVVNYDTEQADPEQTTMIPQLQCQPDEPAIAGELTVEKDENRVQELYRVLGR